MYSKRIWFRRQSWSGLLDREVEDVCIYSVSQKDSHLLFLSVHLVICLSNPSARILLVISPAGSLSVIAPVPTANAGIRDKVAGLQETLAKASTVSPGRFYIVMIFVAVEHYISIPRV